MQRHPVTEVRQNSGVTKDGGLTIGDRIKDRLSELGRDVKWLHHKTGIPVSSLYEIMNGRMKSTTRLPTIAAALGLRALWLETRSGPRLVTDADEPSKHAAEWPFSFSLERWNQILPKQRKQIEEVVVRMLEAFEAGRSVPPKSGAPQRGRRAAG